MILLIDNYDSFAHNLARYIELLGQPVRVIRNDQIKLASCDWSNISAVVISPGPCAPAQAGITLPLLSQAIGKVPVLGVCLGHQAIIQNLGGTIIPSGAPVHGRASLIQHDQTAEFEGLPNPLQVGRYHSLIAQTEHIPDCLTVSAQHKDGTIMAVRHRDYPVVGWQFHPESILTPQGFNLLAGFFRWAGLACEATPDFAKELTTNQTDDNQTWPTGVTF